MKVDVKAEDRINKLLRINSVIELYYSRIRFHLSNQESSGDLI